jgi:photosystem II stability/assembly factor-like uncharacterized protein
MRSFKLSILILLLVFSVSLQAQSIVQLQQGKPTSIRGLSVVDDNVAWVSGSRGYIGITRNGGKDWTWQQVKGFEKADFRDIEAFSDKNAVIMSSGTPALVLKTTDGGATWQEKYRNTDTTYFFDAMDFDSRKHGLILGDPIKGKFLLMETKDGGETWAPFKNMPDALPGEGAFAASGTCLRIGKKGSVDFVTGGNVARHFSIGSPYDSWSVDNLPIKQGKASQGAFSYADFNVVVGGDYSNDKDTDQVAVYYDTMMVSIKNGLEPSRSGPAGFQSCVEEIKNAAFLSTGTPGSNITTNGGKTWKQIDTTSYNVCRKAKHGKLILLAGNGGKIGILKM